MSRRRWLVALAALGLCAGLAQAGRQYSVWCETEDCDFRARLGIGGGFFFTEVVGYCKVCGGMTTLSWSQDKPEKRRKPVAEFWDPVTGTTRRLYQCPWCGKPFVCLERIEEFRFCPKCGKESIKHEAGAHYD